MCEPVCELKKTLLTFRYARRNADTAMRMTMTARHRPRISIWMMRLVLTFSTCNKKNVTDRKTSELIRRGQIRDTNRIRIFLLNGID